MSSPQWFLYLRVTNSLDPLETDESRKALETAITATYDHAPRGSSSLTVVLDDRQAIPVVPPASTDRLAQWSTMNGIVSKVYSVAQSIVSTQLKTLLFSPSFVWTSWCGYNVLREFAPDESRVVIPRTYGSDSWRQITGERKLVKLSDVNLDGCDVYTLGQAVSQIPATVQLPRSSLNHIAMGGTFDHLHAGHKILLTMAMWATNAQLFVGVTDDALLVNKKHAKFLESMSARTQNVRDFLYLVRHGTATIPHDCYEGILVGPIADVAGPTATDPTFDGVVVSEETVSGANAINEIRAKNAAEMDIDMKPLEQLVIDIIGNDGKNQVGKHDWPALKLSSTAIRAEIASKNDA